MDLFLLTFAAFGTSILTALLGLGGGVVLMLLMPGLMPLAAIVPVHAVVQTISNVARVGFAWREIDWSLVPALAAGSAVGALLGSQSVGLISLDWLPAIAGVIILVITWIPAGRWSMNGPWALAALGFYQTGLGMLAGATGPLGAAVLAKMNPEREWLVTNTGVYMILNHAFRSIAFALLGFSFWPWWHIIAVMGSSMVVGAYIGTRLRLMLPARNFPVFFRWLITGLAIRMVIMALIERGIF